MRHLRTFIFLSSILILLTAGTAGATPVMCQTVTLNHMNVDTSLVSACLDAGTGNINGNLNGANPDQFLTGVGSAYSHIGAGAWAQANNNGGNNPNSPPYWTADGTFSLSSTLWNTYSDIAIGFKFGAGGNADNWFVYKLNSGVSSGAWALNKTAKQGGGLSHVILYGIEDTNPPQDIPEPTSLLLLGAGLSGLAIWRRKK